jgi:hypothetical protein
MIVGTWFSLEQFINEINCLIAAASSLRKQKACCLTNLNKCTN